MYEVTTQAFANGGACIASIETGSEQGKKVFVWGALPNERVSIQVTRDTKHYLVANVARIIKASEHRVLPRDVDSYASTSPLQIADFEYENSLKAGLIKDAFTLQKTDIERLSARKVEVKSDGNEYNYRNKYNFAFLPNTFDFACTLRGTHTLFPAKTISLPTNAVLSAANMITEPLTAINFNPKYIKSLLIRSNSDEKTIARLYVTNEELAENVMDVLSKSEKLTKLAQSNALEVVFYDNFLPPKQSKSLKNSQKHSNSLRKRQLTLTDTICNRTFTYSIDSFWQVNQAVYEMCLRDIKNALKRLRAGKNRENACEILDLYSGVGSIGLTVSEKDDFITLVEIDENSHEAALINIQQNSFQHAKAIKTSADKVLSHISKDQILILDPPRAGISTSLQSKIQEVMPKTVIYLSCNPVTQARDIKPLLEKYKIEFNCGYNFFSKTAHVEHLVVLSRENE
ncbi:MAG: RsmD family RNA methyltransferase [Bifidobacteriaceae bacterium]|jgi:23S rRNA (uracil1939-C5)-methyltransferase|nr:RsmD family RNA methyltransferase [Bifidobacteriaceae bacterium]